MINLSFVMLIQMRKDGCEVDTDTLELNELKMKKCGCEAKRALLVEDVVTNFIGLPCRRFSIPNLIERL